MATKKPTKKITTKKHLAREHREARQTRVILIVAIAVGAIVIGLVLYGIIDQTVIRPRTPVARVGDAVITVRAFESYVQYTRVQLLNQSFQYYTFHQQFGEFGGNFLQTAQSIAMQLTQPVSLGREILDEMIDNLIVREEAEKRGITVSQAEIDEAIFTAFGFFPDGTPTPTVTATIQSTPTLSLTQLALITPTHTPTEVGAEPASLDETTEMQPPEGDDDAEVIELEPLEAEPIEPVEQEEALDPTGFEAELTATPEVTPTITLTPTPYTTAIFGQNIRDFNSMYRMYNFDINDLREIFEIQLLREKLMMDITQDMLPVRDEAWARHILVKTREEALEVLSRLDEGEDFHALAEIYSIDESNRERGGDLGWFDQNTMVPAFSDVAFSLGIGEISEPVETEFGFHIIQTLGLRESQIPSAEFMQQRQMTFDQWLIEQRESRDDIVISDNWDTFVPVTPEVPQQFLVELYQQQQ